MTGRRLAALLGRRVAGDEETVVQMLVARAEARLAAQRRETDALDLKALGLLGADAVVVGVLIAVHDAVNRFWWLPASGLAVAGVLLLATIWPRELDTGPRWQTFYERFGSGTALEVARYMLAELLEALDANDEAAAAWKSESVVKLSLVLITLSLVGAIPVAVLG
jgi:hypothetical protein